MKTRWALAAALLLGLLTGTVGAAPLPRGSWDGTWAGNWNKDGGIELVIAGDKVTGVYRDGDFPEILSSAASPEGSMLVVWWIGGDGFLQRTGDGAASISLRERDQPIRNFTLRRE